MAGEKAARVTNDKKNVKVAEPKVLKSEATVTMTPAELQAIIKGAVEGVVKNMPGMATPAQIKQTSTELSNVLATRVNDRIQRGGKFFQKLVADKKNRRLIQIDSIYREYVGSAVTVTINGSTIKVPVDGKPYYVHSAHYAAIREKLQHISELRARTAQSEAIFGAEAGDYEAVSK